MKIYLLVLIGSMHIGLFAQSDSAFAENAVGRIFVSKDLGENWSRSDNGFPSEAVVNALALADNIVIAATEEHGIYISTDGLKSWSAPKGILKNEKVNAVTYHHGLVFAGTYRNGIFISNDNGRSWKPANNGLTVESIRCFHSAGNILLAGADQGVYRSDDNGNTWKLVSRGNQINSFTSKGSVLFAATSHGILRSENGTDWISVWDRATVISIAQNDHEMIAMSDGPVYLAAGTEGKYWIRLHQFFDRYTFRLTPSSDRLFIAPFKKTLKALNNNEYFYGRGLPDKVAFSGLLETPYGVIVAVGFTGC